MPSYWSRLKLWMAVWWDEFRPWVIGIAVAIPVIYVLLRWGPLGPDAGGGGGADPCTVDDPLSGCH